MPQYFVDRINTSVPDPEIPTAIGKIVRRVMESETNVKWKPLVEKWSDAGEIGGVPARIKQSGERTKIIWDGTDDPDPYRHNGLVVGDDGVNAVYIHDVDEVTTPDDSRAKPYEPYIRDTSKRYTFE